MNRRGTAGRTGPLVLVTLTLGGAMAFALVGRRAPDAPPRSIATVGSQGLTFALVGLSSDACVSTVRACLESVPGVRTALVGRSSASIAVAASSSVDERSVIAAVRATGHEIAGSDSVAPRLAPLSEQETRQLDDLKGEWLDVRLKPPACLYCCMALEGRVQELAGVKEVVVIHTRDHMAIRRDPSLATSKLVEHIRAITREPVTVAPTKRIALTVANMTCNKCIGQIRGVLLRTDRVLSPTVELGRANVIVETGTDGTRIKDAIESVPGPSCKSMPVHVFKASVIDERDDGVQR